MNGEYSSAEMSRAFLIPALGFIVGLTLVYWRFGGPSAFTRWSRGDAIEIVDLDIWLTGRPGEDLEPRIALRNLRWDAVQVLGAETSCSCVRPVNLPLEIAGRECEEVIFSIDMSGTRANTLFEYTVTFHGTGSIRGHTTIHINVLEPSQGEEL